MHKTLSFTEHNKNKNYYKNKIIKIKYIIQDRNFLNTIRAEQIKHLQFTWIVFVMDS